MYGNTQNLMFIMSEKFIISAQVVQNKWRNHFNSSYFKYRAFHFDAEYSCNNCLKLKISFIQWQGIWKVTCFKALEAYWNSIASNGFLILEEMCELISVEVWVWIWKYGLLYIPSLSVPLIR